MVQSAFSDATESERQGKAHSLDPRTKLSRDALRRQAHAMLDDMLDYSETIRERPV